MRSCGLEMAVVIVTVEGAANEWTDLGFMVRHLMWRQTPVAGSRKKTLTVCVCVDNVDISVMDSVLIESVRGLITITKLITLAGAGSVRTCHCFQ